MFDYSVVLPDSHSMASLSYLIYKTLHTVQVERIQNSRLIVFLILLHLHGIMWILLLKQVVRLGMFEVHCDELIRALSKRADALSQKLLARMAKDHQEANKK